MSIGQSLQLSARVEGKAGPVGGRKPFRACRNLIALTEMVLAQMAMATGSNDNSVQ